MVTVELLVVAFEIGARCVRRNSSAELSVPSLHLELFSGTLLLATLLLPYRSNMG